MENENFEFRRLKARSRRSLAETQIYRYKHLIGDKLKARSWENQQVSRLGCAILNRMILSFRHDQNDMTPALRTCYADEQLHKLSHTDLLCLLALSGCTDMYWQCSHGGQIGFMGLIASGQKRICFRLSIPVTLAIGMLLGKVFDFQHK